MNVVKRLCIIHIFITNYSTTLKKSLWTGWKKLKLAKLEGKIIHMNFYIFARFEVYWQNIGQISYQSNSTFVFVDAYQQLEHISVLEFPVIQNYEQSVQMHFIMRYKHYVTYSGKVLGYTHS